MGGDSSTNQHVRVPSDMQLDLNNLPSDPELLQRLVRDIATAIDHRDTEIERLIDHQEAAENAVRT